MSVCVGSPVLNCTRFCVENTPTSKIHSSVNIAPTASTLVTAAFSCLVEDRQNTRKIAENFWESRESVVLRCETEKPRNSVFGRFFATDSRN